MKLFLATFCAIVLCAAPAVTAPAAVGSLCDLHYPSDDEVEWECKELKEGDTPYGLFGRFWEDVLRFNRIVSCTFTPAGRSNFRSSSNR